MAEADPRLSIGGNNPPPDPDPLAALTIAVEDAYDEAKLWLDGQKVANQGQADQLGILHTSLDDAEKLAEKTRKALKQPHLDAGAAVDAIYVPLRDKAEKARKAVKRAVQIWNDEVAALAAIEAERVRKAAEDAEALAQKMRDEAQAANNLSAMEEAEQQFENANTLAGMAKAIEKAPIITKTAGARGIGKVPMHWVGRIVDPKATLQHYMVAQREGLVAWLADQVTRDVRAGSRVIPGCLITEEKKL